MAKYIDSIKEKHPDLSDAKIQILNQQAKLNADKLSETYTDSLAELQKKLTFLQSSPLYIPAAIIAVRKQIDDLKTKNKYLEELKNDAFAA